MKNEYFIILYLLYFFSAIITGSFTLQNQVASRYKNFKVTVQENNKTLRSSQKAK